MTYDETVKRIEDYLEVAISHVRTELQRRGDLAKYGVVDVEALAKQVVNDLSWSYGSSGRR